MFGGKPIIGLVGGIGSGKSFVASLLADEGCCVIDSDKAVATVYRLPEVKQQILHLFGSCAISPDGTVNRKYLADRVFADSDLLKQLEQVLYPRIDELRKAQMAAVANDAQVVAFVWDAPLLIEAGLHTQCDRLVFVDAPLPVRLERVRSTRGWDAAEMERREKLQLPLDKKREISDHIILNTAGADQVRMQVREVLSRIVAGVK